MVNFSTSQQNTNLLYKQYNFFLIFFLNNFSGEKLQAKPNTQLVFMIYGLWLSYSACSRSWLECVHDNLGSTF